MKRILILNLTRVGDLIQTTPLMAGLKEADPECEITMLANVSFAGICKHLPNIDHLMTFDVAQFIKKEGTAILDIYKYIDRVVAGLKEKKFDTLVNLSHSKLSAIFGRMLDIPDVRGVYSTEDGFKVVNDPWLAYFSGLIDFRLYNTFNLVDIYQLGGGVKPKARGLLVDRKGPDEAVLPMLKELGIREGDAVIGIQAGASRKDRRWPPEKFAAAADAIGKKRNAKVLLFGAPSEKELGDEVAAQMKHTAINLVGKTSLEELIGLVGRCDLLVTNDTATMHIASAVGTPVVALFFVHAYPWETGPYSKGNVIIEPDISCFPCSHHTSCPHYACFDKVSSEDVAMAAELLSEVEGDAELKGGAFPTARLFTSYFDETGFWDMGPIKKEKARKNEIIGRMYRQMFMQPYLQGNSEQWTDYLKRNYINTDARETVSWVEKETDVFRKLAKTAGEAMKILSDMQRDYRKGKVDKIKRGSEKIMAIDQKISLMGEAHEELKPIIRMFIMGKENIPDTALEVIFVQTKTLYKGVQDSTAFIIRLLKEWKTASDVPAGESQLVDCK